MTYLNPCCYSTISHLVSFNTLVFFRESSIDQRKIGSFCIDGVWSGASLVHPWHDDLRVCFHSTHFLWNDKDFIWNEIGTIFCGLTLGIAQIHHPAHVHVAQVIPASTWKNLQRYWRWVFQACIESITRMSEWIKVADIDATAEYQQTEGSRLHDCLVCGVKICWIASFIVRMQDTRACDLHWTSLGSLVCLTYKQSANRINTISDNRKWNYLLLKNILLENKHCWSLYLHPK